jgi:formylglycine-generating enzyme required for sulfatase activity
MLPNFQERIEHSLPALYITLLALLLIEASSGAEPNNEQKQIGNADSLPKLIVPFSAEAAKREQAILAKRLGTTVEIISKTCGMRVRLIPPGDFLMGSPIAEDARDDSEVQHLTRLTKPFWIGVYEVTQAEYSKIMGENPSCFSTEGVYSDKVIGMDTSRFPVEGISRFDAMNFCNKLSISENMPEFYQLTDVELIDTSITKAKVTFVGGNGYRLPTEAEWEYACRAGTTTAFSFGNSANGREANLNGNGPYRENAKGPYLERPAKVGSYVENSFGLFDMHGNVDEWCQDWYMDYAKEPPKITLDPLELEPNKFDHVVSRGGAWLHYASVCRSAHRMGSSPRFPSDTTGFRLARSP